MDNDRLNPFYEGDDAGSPEEADHGHSDHEVEPDEPTNAHLTWLQGRPPRPSHGLLGEDATDRPLQRAEQQVVPEVHPVGQAAQQLVEAEVHHSPAHLQRPDPPSHQQNIQAAGRPREANAGVVETAARPPVSGDLVERLQVHLRQFQSGDKQQEIRIVPPLKVDLSNYRIEKKNEETQAYQEMLQDEAAAPYAELWTSILGMMAGEKREPPSLAKLWKLLQTAEKKRLNQTVAKLSKQDMQDLTKNVLEEMAVKTTAVVNVIVPPPDKYSAVPTITSEARVVIIDQYFKRPKFTGGKKPTDITVVEYLSSLTRAQKSAMLSYDEFRDKMLQQTTGSAYLTLEEWITDPFDTYDVDELYRMMTNLYFYEDTPEEARAKLAKLAEQHTFKTLHQAVAGIRKLARLATYDIMYGKDRDNAFEDRAVSAFKKITHPDTLRSLRMEIERVRGCKDCELSFRELTRMAETFAPDYAAHFRSLNRKAKDPAKSNAVKGGKGGKNKAAKTQAVVQQQPEDVKKKSGKKDGSKGNGKGFKAFKPNPNNQGGSQGQQNQSPKHRNGNNNPNRTSQMQALTMKVDALVDALSTGPTSSPGPASSANTSAVGGKAANTPIKRFEPRGFNYGCDLCPSKEHQAISCPMFKPEHRTIVADICLAGCGWGRYHAERFCPARYRE